jgi:hypothetical protein
MTLPSSKQNDPKDYVCIDSTGPLKKGSASATTWRTHVFTTIPYHCI